MKKMYIGFDIHKEYLTGAAMNSDGIVEFSGNVPKDQKSSRMLSQWYTEYTSEDCDRGVRNILTHKL